MRFSLDLRGHFLEMHFGKFSVRINTPVHLVSPSYLHHDIQGDPKKTIHSVLQPKSVVVVQFYFFTGVSEPEL